MNEMNGAIDEISQVDEDCGIKALIGLEDCESPALMRGAQAVSEDLEALQDMANVSSKWTQISGITDVLARSILALTLAAAAVLSGFQTARDIETGQPLSIKVLNIVEDVAVGVGFLVEAGSGAAALAGFEVASMISVVRVIAAEVGIVVAVAMMCLKRKPPPTPQETFMKNTGVDFSNGKPGPTKEWLDKQKKGKSTSMAKNK